MNEETLFAEALQRSDPDQRAAFLEQACGADAELRQRIEELLRAHDQAGGLLDKPAATLEGTSDAPLGQWLDPGALPEAPPEGVGSRIGPYKLLQKLGEGGMGTVWMAEQQEPVQRRVAVKVIKSGLDSAHVLARFEAERQALALMDHPNIARVLDAGATPKGRPFVVMELVKGIPITKFCDQEQLSPRQRLELFAPVCQAVQHAHQKGIIHRDIKPSNVLIAAYDGKPVPKVIDFGVAKATDRKLTERTMFTEVGQIVGTLEYMSPEQAELNNLDVDTRADIYSLGVLLYELLTGSPPFTSRQLRAAAFAEMLRIIREVEPAKPSTKLSSSEELPSIAAKRKLEPKRLTKLVQGELDWITMKCLEKERSRRYETANGLALDIQRYLADEPVLAGPPSVGYRLRKFVHRNKGPVLAATLLVLALVGGITGTSLGLLRAEAARRAVEEQRRLAEQERDDKERARKEVEANAKKAKHQEALALMQKREAEKQAAVARAVNAFLQKDLLRQSDVGQQMLGEHVQRDPDVKVRTLLDRAAKAIEGKFADQPLTEAEIRLTIGDAYQALGRYEEARPHLERSVQVWTAQLGADHPDTLNSKGSLATLYHAQGKYDRAEPLFTEVLQARIAKLGAQHLKTLVSKNNLALLYHDQGRYDRAGPLFQEALQAQTATLGADHPHTLNSKGNLAQVYRHLGRYVQAEALFKEVLQTRTAQLGSDHPQTLISKSSLGLLYQAQSKYDLAEQLLEEVLELSTAKLGPNHPQTLAGKSNLAVLYVTQFKHDLAEPLHKESLELFTAKLGPNHPHTLSAKGNLAGLYYLQRKFDRAEPLLREVLQARLAQLGADHPDTLLSKHNLAQLYAEQRKYAQAETLFKEVLQARIAKLGEAHPGTLTCKHSLADLYKVQGKHDRAETLYKEVLRTRTAQVGTDHPDTLQTKNNLAALYWRLGRLKESVPLFEELLPIYRRKLGVDHPYTLRVLANLGVNYRDAGRIAEALPLLEEAVQRAGHRPGGIPATLDWIPTALAQTYDRAGQFAKSEPLYRSILDQNRKQYGDEHLTTAAQMANLGYNLLQQKKYADAESMLRDCLAVREKMQPDLWTTFGTRSILGEALVGQKKYADAEPLLVQGYEGMKQREKSFPPPDKIHFINALERLVHCYDAWGKKDKADEWRKKLDDLRKASSPARKEKQP